ncbi:MAG TPA: hypothetical protein PLU81_06430 [Deltaproteobacteria bacterium]|nr:hypothetical protein [Deltaproteobacteria bacterium]
MALLMFAVIITGRMKAFSYHACFLLVLCVVSSCSMFRNGQAEGPVREILSYDGLSSIQVPLSWVQLDVHERAVIEAADLNLQQFLVVMSENKFGYWQFMGLDLEGFFHMKSWYLIDTLSDVSLGRQQEDAIHGNSAIMLEITGIRDREHISYLYTAVEGYHHYHEIILWTPTSRYEQVRPLFLRIVKSFDEQ